ncbi:nitroreductase/quinone reductase family protein [Nocardia lijiangensis]|uniref:nitroreductase/quinone reductase family protein n=1 Tax=Nocardia lijiangensis TaxID=299618 RepID=UPI003D71AE0E
MSESTPIAGDATSDESDAPWNREYTAQEIAAWNRGVIEEFRANGGSVGGDYTGIELILLTTTGAKSGKPHVVPLGLLRRDDILYVSSFVQDKYPAWFHNVQADPRVTLELGDRTHTAVAKVLRDAEYEEFAAWVAHHNPSLAEYQATVSLPLPLVTLSITSPN